MGKINIGRGEVKRYWPGKATEWGAIFADEDERIRMSGAVALENAFHSQEDSRIVRRDDDRRLIRVAESRMNSRGDIIADRKRRIRLADDIVSSIREEDKITREGSTGLDEDALEERRRILREKLLKRQQEEEAAFIQEEEEEEEEEEEFEYETDFENEIMMGLVLVKPVFVSTSENGTIAERERLEARKRAHEEITEKQVEERKLETKWILAQEIWKDEQVQKNIELREANFADIDTDEEVKKVEELEAWMAREIARIKRDKEEPGAMSKRKE